MGRSGHVDQRRPIAQLLLKLLAVLRRRDLILCSLQDQVSRLPRRRPPSIERGAFRGRFFDTCRSWIKRRLEKPPGPSGICRIGQAAGLSLFLDYAHTLKWADDRWRAENPALAAKYPPDT